MKTYSSYYGTSSTTGDIQRIINNNSADNLTWGMEMINDAARYLVPKYYFNERTFTPAGGTVANQQFYPLPPQLDKLINLTVTIGSVLWQPKECPSRAMWDNLNVIQFSQDFPSYFFIYNGQVGIWPTPASNGNVISMNYKTRTIDLSMPDVTDVTSSQTMTTTQGSTTLTASGSVFLNWMVGQWFRIPYTSVNTTCGDNQWYQIASITNATTAVLMQPYGGSSITGAPFTIGQVSLIPENYQDLPLYRMGEIYYTTRITDVNKAGLYKQKWDEGFEALNDQFGSKTNSVVVNDTDVQVINPSLFPRSITGH